MELLTLNDNAVRFEDERTLLLGVVYDADTDQHLEADGEIGAERERFDDQILAGLVSPW